MRRWFLALVAVALSLTLGLGTAVADDSNDVVDVSVVIPGSQRGVDDAVLSWSLNAESGSGAYFGGCNFLSAGKAGDTGSSRLWTQGDGFFKAKSGNVTIEKPTAKGGWVAPTWSDKCIDARTGSTVLPNATDWGTGSRFVLTNGSGTVDVGTDSAKVSWAGTVTVVAYGGLTYFWLSDPVLEISDGKGTLTATAGGYAADQQDTSKWSPLRERKVTLATLTKVDLASDLGFTAAPAYHGVKIDTADDSQYRQGDYWGGFPQSFVDFTTLVGQGPYWYSTNSLRDFAKPPLPLSVSWSADDRVDEVAPTTPPRGDGGPNTSGGGPTTSSAAPADPSTTAPTSGQAGTSGSGTTGGATARPIAATAAPVAVPAAEAGIVATSPDALLSARGLIPAAAAAIEDPRALLVIASSALAALAAVAGLGFRRRWFVLPWSKG